LPPLILTEKDRDWIINSLDKTIADTHQVTGSIGTLGKNLVGHALKNRK
jgi:ornithine--oxo-acid transaminase